MWQQWTLTIEYDRKYDNNELYQLNMTKNIRHGVKGDPWRDNRSGFVIRLDFGHLCKLNFNFSLKDRKVNTKRRSCFQHFQAQKYFGHIPTNLERELEDHEHFFKRTNFSTNSTHEFLVKPWISSLSLLVISSIPNVVNSKILKKLKPKSKSQI